MAKEGGNDYTSLIILLGGAAAAYWYITNYGPNGAVSAGNVSWWTTWFGGTAAALPPASTTTTPPTPTPTGTPTGTGTGTGSSTGVTATVLPLVIPNPFVVTSDINGAVKGTVQINGVATSLDVILANIGQPTGVVWNTQGADVTASLPAGVLAPLVAAYQQAAQNAGLSGIVPAFQDTGNTLPGGVGAIPSMSFGKGFAGGFSGRRKSTGPMSRNLVN